MTNYCWCFLGVMIKCDHSFFILLYVQESPWSFVRNYDQVISKYFPSIYMIYINVYIYIYDRNTEIPLHPNMIPTYLFSSPFYRPKSFPVFLHLWAAIQRGSNQASHGSFRTNYHSTCVYIFICMHIYIYTCVFINLYFEDIGMRWYQTIAENIVS